MSEESPRLRLRPKLAGDPPASQPAMPGAPPAPAAAPLVPVLNPPAAVATPAPAAPPDFAARAQNVQRAALLILALGVVIFAGVAAIAFPRIRALEKTFLADQGRSPEETSHPPPPPTAPPALLTPAPAASASTAPVVASPPLAATPPAVPAASASETQSGPSVEFRAWVQNTKITGLRTGEKPRILLGRSSFNVGDVVHPELGIVFDGYDPDRRMLRFKDATGATVERRHP